MRGGGFLREYIKNAIVKMVFKQITESRSDMRRKLFMFHHFIYSLTTGKALLSPKGLIYFLWSWRGGLLERGAYF